MRQLSWQNFLSTVFVKGQQRTHLVTERPRIELFGDGVANRIGIWLEIESGAVYPPELSKLASITIRTIARDGREFVEVGTVARSLHRQFFHFAHAVIERVVSEELPPIAAVSLELKCFADLLEQQPLLGTERQVGLIGELLLLERLVKKLGIVALDSWVGHTGEPHDFRLANLEFEVKTTVSSRRVHTIHGHEQLLPSAGCNLFILSVMLGPAGTSQGFSLAEKVTGLLEFFAAVPDRLSQFAAAIKDCGFHDDHRAHYTRRFVLRRPLALVPVDDRFPAISRLVIQHSLGDRATRIESLRYDVNLEGLEHEEGTVAFDAVLPREG